MILIFCSSEMAHTQSCVSRLLFVWDCCSHYAECYRRLLFCEWPMASLCSQPVKSADVMSNNFIVSVFSTYNKSLVSSVSGSRIGTEEALYLYTSGPDLTSIMPCKYGKPTEIFTKFVTEDSLRSEHLRELFIKNKDVDTAALVVSQAFNNVLGFYFK